jgi:hypothetical protein
MARAAEVGELIQTEAARRAITRLCHLTPLRNLLQIATGAGLMSVTDLNADERAVFDQQDLSRYDNRPEHISCSVQYPNVWYLRSRRRDATPLQRLFPDWVCLLIDPRYLWQSGTEFCHRNAGTAGGSLLKPGYEAFTAMYGDRVIGSGGRTYIRSRKPIDCPTDDQAEVMIHKRIALTDARSVVVADDAQARRVTTAIRLAGGQVDAFDYFVAPDFFDIRLSGMLARGQRPVETRWDPVADDGS